MATTKKSKTKRSGRRKLQRRAAVAKRLEDWARRLRAGLPIRVGGKVVHVPARVEVEAEFERESGEAELEIEIKWPESKRPKLRA
jgi:amphi-Trp domain-containing protein